MLPATHHFLEDSTGSVDWIFTKKEKNKNNTEHVFSFPREVPREGRGKVYHPVLRIPSVSFVTAVSA